MEKWDAQQYLKFKKYRTQPAVDLANTILADKPLKAVDIGCGPGNSTAVLQKRFPSAVITGVDNSADMLETAQKNCPDCHFIYCDIANELHTLEKDYDIVFSNACIQWVPNHPQLLEQMIGLLKNGGTLAVQIPLQQEQPMHRIIRKLAQSKFWSPYFSVVRDFFILTPGEYFDLLSELTDDFTIWKTTYCHQMNSYEELIEWYRGTGLRPYLAALPKELRADFENQLKEKIRQVYPQQKNGKIMFEFPRLFFLAIRR